MRKNMEKEEKTRRIVNIVAAFVTLAMLVGGFIFIPVMMSPREAAEPAYGVGLSVEKVAELPLYSSANFVFGGEEVAETSEEKKPVFIIDEDEVESFGWGVASVGETYIDEEGTEREIPEGEEYFEVIFKDDLRDEKVPEMQAASNAKKEAQQEEKEYSYWDFPREDELYVSDYARVPNGSKYENIRIEYEDVQNGRLYLANMKFVPTKAKFQLEQVTHYCPCAACCGSAPRYNGGAWLEITFSGHQYEYGDHFIAIDKETVSQFVGFEVKDGTLVAIMNEDGTITIYSVEDRGVKGLKADIFHRYHKDAVGFNKNVTIWILDYPESRTLWPDGTEIDF